MMLIAAEDDLQASQHSSVTVNALENGPYSSSSDMVTQPGSSWIDEFERQVEGNDTLLSGDHLVPHKRNDDMAIDYEDQAAPQFPLHYRFDAPHEKTGEFPREDFHLRKRSASSHETENTLRKPKMLEDNQNNQSEFSEPAFSFTKPKDSFVSNATHPAVSGAPFVNTSFNSVFTDVHESFVTNATPPSFHLQTGNGISDVNAPSGLQAGSIEPSDNLQEHLQMFKQASPFGKPLIWHSMPCLITL